MNRFDKNIYELINQKLKNHKIIEFNIRWPCSLINVYYINYRVNLHHF